jgi:hypothetical protein
MGLNDFEDLEFEEVGGEDSLSTSRGSNRTFLIVAGILGGILLLALLAIAAYAVLVLPGREPGQQTQAAEIIATNTAIAEQAQLTAVGKQVTVTPTFTATSAPTDTPTPSLTPSSTSTPVLAPTNTPEPDDGTPDPAATATVAALLTQQAAGGGAATPIPTATALPDTGFADDFGVPGLALIAGVLMVIIILSRRLRTSTS